MLPILILHGANLNLLGCREPDIYGDLTLDGINQRLAKIGKDLGLDVRSAQSNSEGVLIDNLQDAHHWARAIVFNPGGYTHTSVALRDTIAAIEPPVVEVHISNIHARETFRHHSMITPVCAGSISGFGWYSYVLGLYAVVNILKQSTL